MANKPEHPNIIGTFFDLCDKGYNVLIQRSSKGSDLIVTLEKGKHKFNWEAARDIPEKNLCNMLYDLEEQFEKNDKLMEE